MSLYPAAPSRKRSWDQHQRDTAVGAPAGSHRDADADADGDPDPGTYAMMQPLPASHTRSTASSRHSGSVVSDSWLPWPMLSPGQAGGGGGGDSDGGSGGVGINNNSIDPHTHPLPPLYQRGSAEREAVASDRGGSLPQPRTATAEEAAAAADYPADEVTVPQAASFFRTYFAVVHPQYPFLDRRQCAAHYTAWKRARARLIGWPAFFVKMIFALGSLIEAKADNAPSFQHQNLKSTAQAEQAILTDASASTALTRLQAMLLSAMFALHAENTWRIAHISGVIIKFAAVHRFHRLRRGGAGDPDAKMALRVWSSAYVLDRAVSTALGIPVSLPDMYITSPLYGDEDEETEDDNDDEDMALAPWLADCDGLAGEGGPRTDAPPDLRTFAHICKIRALQSYFLHQVEVRGGDDAHDVDGDGDDQLLLRLRAWEATIPRHSIPDSAGYRSPVWLQHIGHLTRLSLCGGVTRARLFGAAADAALQAGCAACTTFRALQKRRQIAQPWLVVLSQFRAAVTLWYIVWGRAASAEGAGGAGGGDAERDPAAAPPAVPAVGVAATVAADPLVPPLSDALRDCSAVLAIFAERWPRAEPYRDCFELLASAVPRSRPPGCLAADARRRLARLARQLEASGIHRATARMLREMGGGTETEWN